MPRQIATSVEKNFVKGLITEASGLNFPENACTETYDCVFNLTGSVERRLGFDFEAGYAEKTINRTDLAISSYLWKNVAGDGNLSLFVMQVGPTIYFFDTSGTAVSAGALTTTLALSSFLASGAPAPDQQECQYSSGNKYLIVTHPYCAPFYVSFNTSTKVASGTAITLQIRDLEGDTADPYAVDERPTSDLASLDVHHKYNLYNQGWITDNLNSWDSSQTTMPSNVDVMWSFKNSSDAFDMGTLAHVMHGNSAAPKGHFILTLWDQDRETVSGITGATKANTSYQRPSTSAFFSGRIFYSGLNYLGHNCNIYFTQIIERDAQYGYCYQSNDLTSEGVFDLEPSDGGVIRIPEAGTIYKLVSLAGALAVFANNGIWIITGSTGLGFSAKDYTIARLSTINALSASSFVDVGGVPAWWNAEAIYILAPGQGGSFTPQPLSYTTVKSFYDDIPITCKLAAKGFYNPITGVIQWLYRSTGYGTPTERYTYDRIMNYNINTQAFYPWKVPATAVTFNGIVVLDGAHGAVDNVTILDAAGDTVVDAASDTVTVFTFVTSGSGSVPAFKYITSYVSGGSYKFSMAESNSIDLLDFVSLDAVGQSYTSYFISGYKLHGSGNRKFQPQWLTTFNDISGGAVKYYFQSIWDYAVIGSGTGRWSTNQLVTRTNTDFAVGTRRLKIRGSGKALQFKVTSFQNEPFNIIGWVGWETANSMP